MARILIADDEPDMVMGLRDNLQFEGYEVLEAVDGEEAVRLVKEQSPDLMLLDVMMPKLDGLEVCQQLRQAGFTLPVLMLTAKGQEVDIIRGLEIGADDYVTKPFSIRELLARIKVALRHSGMSPSTSKRMHVGEAEVDLVSGKVERAGQVFTMGHFEIEILKMLVESAEQPVERTKLLDEIWGLGTYPANRTVDNHIVSLRRKIEKDAKRPRHIVTVHSIGYKFIP